MKYQCRLKNCNKCGGDADNRESKCLWGQGIYGKAVLPTEFCYEPITALKNKV